MAHDPLRETEEPSTKQLKPSKRPLPDDKTDEGEEDCPACNSCRKRKTKCSRQQPCFNCVRLQVDCIYDESKERPGIKPGTIALLTQRVSILEQMLLGQGILLEPFLERAAGLHPSGQGSLEERAESLKQKYLSAARSPPAQNPLQNVTADHHSLESRSQNGEADTNCVLSDSTDDLLPPEERLISIVDIYCDQIHPWIPILHVASFREQLADRSKRSQLTPILQAIVSVCLRFDSGLAMPEKDKRTLALKCRNAVILQGMEKFSVENLQALVIVAFDIVNGLYLVPRRHY